MKKLLTIFPLLGFFFMLATGLSAASDQRPFSPNTTPVFGISHLQADDQAIRFQLNTASPNLNSQNELVAAGLDERLHQSGAPDLPIFSQYVALPPGATARVTVTPVQTNTQMQIAVQPAPTYTGADPEQLRPATEPVARVNTAVYASDALFPYARYTLSAPMYYRDLRVVQLQLYPVRYQPLSQTLHHHAQLAVTVHFDNAVAPDQPTAENPNLGSLTGQLVNPQQAATWRAFPPETAAATTSFPVAADHIFKLTIARDDIYALTGAEMLAAGVPAGTAVNRLGMMQNGESIHFTYDDNGATGTVDAGDVLRFYGFAFDGSKRESFFLPGTRRADGFDVHNVFWLYVNDTAVTPSPIITSVANLADQSGAVTATEHTVVWEPEAYFFSTWTDQWHTFPNEPDAWFADYLSSSTNGGNIVRTYDITATNPAASGPQATLAVEIMTREYGTNNAHEATISLNGSTPSSQTWNGNENLNITQDNPISQVQDGANTVTVTLVDVYQGERVYVNDISLTYRRQLIANNQPFHFADEVGSQEMAISQINTTSPNQVLAWDVTNPRQPSAIVIESGDIAGSTLHLDIDQDADSQFIVTTKNDTTAVTAAMLTPYTPQNLTPPGASAEWLVITPDNFAAAANTLATHRQNAGFGGFTTYIADYDAIINQYGYGLPLPLAIQTYLQEAVANWNTQYVLLIGDATIVPRATTTPMPCPAGCRANWDDDAPTYLITDLQFVDRFQGMIPTDHTFTTLSGGDLLPDVALGRLPAETLAEAQSMVDKIISYETSQLTAQSWLYNVLFVADDTDSAGNFYLENSNVAQLLPSLFNITELGLPDNPDETDVDALYDEMYYQTATAGTAVLNYRGHGSIPSWTGNNRSDNKPLLNASDQDFWFNIGQPTIILSADCLDGFFAYPGELALSESFLKIDDLGTVAHWSSTGLGFTFEHTILHGSFYQGIFNANLPRMGDAINHSKAEYDALNQSASEMYAFTLQGDPAMRVFTPLQSQLYLPAVIKP